MGKEVFFADGDVVVSKTDLKGRIRYVNDVFCSVSGFTEKELIGQPHSLIRNEKMPRCVFKLMWDRISAGHEIFAYVVNTCKNGDHYWVLAHVTPSLDYDGKIQEYHSNRRSPDADIIKNKIMPLYEELLAIEKGFNNRKEGMISSFNHLVKMLENSNVDYDEFIFSICTA